MDDNFKDATSILGRAAKTYSDCSTYLDHGCVVTTFHSGTPTEMTSKIWFTTYFRRPDHFRFSFLMQMMQHVAFPEMIHTIWTAGKSVHVKSPIPSFGAEKTLNLAIAGATGISSCSAHNIPVLLMPGVVSGRRTTDIKNAMYIGPELIGQESCERLQAKSGTKQSDIWISKSRSLILQIQEHDVIGPNVSATMRDRDQIDSFIGLLGFFATSFGEALRAKMLPMPVTNGYNLPYGRTQQADSGRVLHRARSRLSALQACNLIKTRIYKAR
jgi:hypothetical protein